MHLSKRLRPLSGRAFAATAGLGRGSGGRTKVKVNRNAVAIEEAAARLKDHEKERPWSAYDLAIQLQGDKSGQTRPLRGRLRLPFPPKARPGTSSQDRILVFALDDKAAEAKAAGAHIVGGEELCAGILGGKYDYTKVLCQAEGSLLRSITPRLARFLGPKGLMPAARHGTVTDELGDKIRELLQLGMTDWRVDKAGMVRVKVGNVGEITEPALTTGNAVKAGLSKQEAHPAVGRMEGGHDETMLASNVAALLADIRQSNAQSGDAEQQRTPTLFKRVVLSSTMGPGIEIQV